MADQAMFPVSLLEEWELKLTFDTDPAIKEPFCREDTFFTAGIETAVYHSGDYILTIQNDAGDHKNIMDFSLIRQDGAVFTTKKYEVGCAVPVVDFYNASPMFVGYAHVNHHNPPTFLASCTSKDSPFVMYGSRNGENRFTIGLENQFIETSVTRGGRGGPMYYDHNIIRFERPVGGVTLRQAEIRDTVYLSTERDNWFNVTRGYFDFVDQRRGYVPVPTPESAYGPHWCSWLYLTDIDEDKIWANALKAKELGIKTLMIDAGWFCNDTDIPFPDSPLDSDSFGFGRIDSVGGKFPDMPGLVDRIHELGLYVWAWCTPRWAFRAVEEGEKRVDQELLDCRIVTAAGKTVPLLCTRHPRTREHAARFTSYLLEKYHFDGLKFDCWEMEGDMDVCVSGHEHDCDTMGEGTIKWGKAIYEAMTGVNPQAVVWLNNTTMKPYSNYSCSPNEVYCQPDENWRMSVLTKTFANGILSHLCEGAWNPAEPDQCLGRQLSILMMGHVPEFQVDLTNLTESHELMVKRFLAFYETHRQNLLYGKYTPFGFEHMLGGPLSTTPPHVKIEGDQESFVYVGTICLDEILLSGEPFRLYFFNLKNINGIKTRISGLMPGRVKVTEYDCHFDVSAEYELSGGEWLDLDSGVEYGGMVRLEVLEETR